ncbi:NAD-dependent epimerase/dehydratase family protein [Litoribacter ruber]|uniref:NAD-dependent epimerase/dehydratase family protein n=1 Tax=Litoribacter ruber TaxID=702568 RepID=UPI001BDAF9F8|nr:NAD-dependent epimerase/dehydratase family protein [Litoribacter ruber]MBT0810636.1 NAD-dependent epimerase/dehydratase family protein [Litoribacter ruber]
MASVLITGSSGFVGKNLVKYFQLDKGFDITEVNRSPAFPNPNYFTFSEFFSDNNHQFNHYIHLAGKAHDVHNASSPEEYFEVNLKLTKKVFDKFLQDSQAETFIYISSVKAVRDSIETALTEEIEPNPLSAYGLSKLKAEQYILENCPSDRKAIILRPCMIHGPENKGNLNLLYSFISRGIPYPLGAFSNFRSFLSIENLCFIIMQVIAKPIATGIYHISDDIPLSTRDLIEIMGDSTGKRARILHVPKPIIRGIAKVGDYLRLPINSERLKKLTENYVVSNSKLTRSLLVELPVSSKQGLFQTFKSFQKLCIIFLPYALF